MRRRIIAEVSTAIIIISLFTAVVLLAEPCVTHQSINPVAVLIAAVVVVAGLVWFKKSVK